jgi:hypothetical protein
MEQNDYFRQVFVTQVWSTVVCKSSPYVLMEIRCKLQSYLADNPVRLSVDSVTDVNIMYTRIS